jgi:hypothetical protein
MTYAGPRLSGIMVKGVRRKFLLVGQMGRNWDTMLLLLNIGRLIDRRSGRYLTQNQR